MLGADNAFALVVFDAGAPISHPRLDLDGVEAAASDDETRWRAVLGRLDKRGEAEDHPVDIRFDIDAGLLFKGALSLTVERHSGLELLAKLRGHDLVDVSESHQRRIARQVFQLVRSTARGDSTGRQPGVIGEKAGSETCAQHQQGSHREISGF
jgi:hypothetical protein